MSEKLETKKEVLEVKVRLVENPKITNFNEDNSTVIFDITNEVPLQMKSNVIKLVSESTAAQLEQISPLIQKVFSLQEIFFTTYDPDDKENSIEKYKGFKKVLTASAIDQAFEPMYREVMNRKDEIVNMKKAFKEDLKNKMLLLDENFKEYVEEENKKKELAEEKKNKKANEMKAELQKAQEKNKQQEIEKSILTAQNKIGQINVLVTGGLNNLSLDGLKKQKEQISKYTFDQFKPDNENVPEEESKKLSIYFQESLNSCIQIIDTKISELELKDENKEIKNQNQVLNAQTPASLNQNNITPNFQQEVVNQQQAPQQQVRQVTTQQSIPNTTQQQPVQGAFPVKGPTTDYNKMLKLKEMFEHYTSSIKEQNEKFISDVKVLSSELSQPALQEFLGKFVDKSAPQISSWMDNTMPWFMKGFEHYENFVKSKEKQQ